MKTLTKQLISIALCFAMICSILPIAAIPAVAAARSTSVADGKTLDDWQTIDSMLESLKKKIE